MRLAVIALACLLMAGACGTPAPTPSTPVATQIAAANSPEPTLAAPSSGPTPSPSPTTIPSPTPTVIPSASPTPGATPDVSGRGSAACRDKAHKLAGPRWTEPLHWKFDASSVPSRYDADEVLKIIQRAFDNVTQARNDCGLPDRIDIEAVYEGTTDDAVCPSEAPMRDYSVIGFGRLRTGRLALNCRWTYLGDYVLSDIRISRSVRWALSEDGCRGGEEMLEATFPHEVGHSFGLDHVGERRHGDLTMSTRSNGPCHNEESTLGLGDILGLEVLYGTH
jgi:hypothetical protein